MRPTGCCPCGRLCVLAMGLVAPCAVDVAIAADLEFTKQSGSWHAPENWRPDQVPTSSDNVFVQTYNGLFPAHATLVTTGWAANLTIGYGSSVTTSNNSLFIGNNLTMTGLSGGPQGPSGLYIGGSVNADDATLFQSFISMTNDSDMFVDSLLIDASSVGAGGAGTPDIWVNDTLNNNGVIYAADGAVLTLRSSFGAADDVWNIDGNTGEGIVRARTGDIVFHDGILSDAFSGVMEVGAGHKIQFNFPWESDGELNLTGSSAATARLAGSQATFTGGTIDVESRAHIEAPALFRSNVQVTLADANAVLDVGQPAAPATLSGVTFQGAGELAFLGDATVTAGTTANIDVGLFSWDGPADDADTVVQSGARLNITGNRIENHLARITIDGGVVDVDTTLPWVAAGRLNLQNAGLLSGTARMTLGGDLTASSLGNRVSSPLTIASGGSVDIGLGLATEVEFEGATTYSGGSYAGGGRIAQSGPATMAASTTIGAFNSFQVIVPGTYKPLHVQQYDWDGDTGSSAQTTINPGVTLTINAVQIDAAADDGYDGTVNINGGTLIVNTGVRTPIPPAGGGTPGQVIPAAPAALPWRLDGVMNLSAGPGQQAAVTTGLGSPMLIYGTVNAAGGASAMSVATLVTGAVNVQNSATLTASGFTVSGGVIDVEGAMRLTGALLQSGANLQISGQVDLIATTTFQGGAYIGSGVLRQMGNASIAATTAFDVNAEFDAGGTTTIAAGQELQLASSGVIRAGAQINGPGVLRNMSGSDLELVQTPLSVHLANAGALILKESEIANPSVGAFTQTSSGSLLIDIGSSSGENDKLTVTGAAVLDGSLELLRFPFSLPRPDAVYTILSANSLAGNFANAAAGARYLTDFGSFQVNYSPTSVTLSNFLPLAGDFNGDGSVDHVDLTQWQARFGVSGSATPAQGDADGDLDVDGADFLAWQREVSSAATATATASIPEPATEVLLVSGTLAMLLRRRSLNSSLTHALYTTCYVEAVEYRA